MLTSTWRERGFEEGVNFSICEDGAILGHINGVDVPGFLEDLSEEKENPKSPPVYQTCARNSNKYYAQLFISGGKKALGDAITTVQIKRYLFDCGRGDLMKIKKTKGASADGKEKKDKNFYLEKMCSVLQQHYGDLEGMGGSAGALFNSG